MSADHEAQSQVKENEASAGVKVVQRKPHPVGKPYTAEFTTVGRSRVQETVKSSEHTKGSGVHSDERLMSQRAKTLS